MAGEKEKNKRTEAQEEAGKHLPTVDELASRITEDALKKFPDIDKNDIDKVIEAHLTKYHFSAALGMRIEREVRRVAEEILSGKIDLESLTKHLNEEKIAETAAAELDEYHESDKLKQLIDEVARKAVAEGASPAAPTLEEMEKFIEERARQVAEQAVASKAPEAGAGASLGPEEINAAVAKAVEEQLQSGDLRKRIEDLAQKVGEAMHSSEHLRRIIEEKAGPAIDEMIAKKGEDAASTMSLFDEGKIRSVVAKRLDEYHKSQRLQDRLNEVAGDLAKEGVQVQQGPSPEEIAQIVEAQVKQHLEATGGGGISQGEVLAMIESQLKEQAAMHPTLSPEQIGTLVEGLVKEHAGGVTPEQVDKIVETRLESVKPGVERDEIERLLEDRFREMPPPPPPPLPREEIEQIVASKVKEVAPAAPGEVPTLSEDAIAKLIDQRLEDRPAAPPEAVSDEQIAKLVDERLKQVQPATPAEGGVDKDEIEKLIEKHLNQYHFSRTLKMRIQELAGRVAQEALAGQAPAPPAKKDDDDETSSALPPVAGPSEEEVAAHVAEELKIFRSSPELQERIDEGARKVAQEVIDMIPAAVQDAVNEAIQKKLAEFESALDTKLSGAKQTELHGPSVSEAIRRAVDEQVSAVEARLLQQMAMIVDERTGGEGESMHTEFATSLGNYIRKETSRTAVPAGLASAHKRDEPRHRPHRHRRHGIRVRRRGR